MGLVAKAFQLPTGSDQLFILPLQVSLLLASPHQAKLVENGKVLYIVLSQLWTGVDNCHNKVGPVFLFFYAGHHPVVVLFGGPW